MSSPATAVRFTIRPAHPEEYEALGRLTVEAYSGLPGMPKVDEQPDYYGMLLDVGARARKPDLAVLAAVDGASGALLGSVDFIQDMRSYGSGGSARDVPDAAGIRLLAVDPRFRGAGVGKALTLDCIERARRLGRSKVVLHTTRAMETAWAMYRKLGFERFPEIDFRQGGLEVFGFSLAMSRAAG